MSLAAVNIPKYATVLNGSVCQLGTGASTVGATALGVDGGAADAKVCYTAGAYGGMVESLLVSSNDTAAVNVLVYAMDGATVHPIGICNVPINSGNLGTVPNVDIINGLVGLPINSVYKKYIPLRAGMTLKVAVLAAMTANKSIWAKTTGVDFIA
jgi:hypothetical protein